MKWTIYSLTVEGDKNPFYVGCTSRTNYRRAIEHKSDTTKKSRESFLEKEEIFKNATKENKQILITKLAEADSEEKAFSLERKWVNNFGRRSSGGCLINRTDGGKGNKGIIYSAESRAKMAAAKIGNKINVGRKRPDMVELFSKELSAYDATGRYLRTFASAREAEKYTGIKYGSISEACLGRIKTARNKKKEVFQFRFGANKKPIDPVLYKASAGLGEIEQLTKDGKVIAVFRNSKEAALRTGVLDTSIRQCVHGKAKTAGKFKWRLKGK